MKRLNPFYWIGRTQQRFEDYIYESALRNFGEIKTERTTEMTEKTQKLKLEPPMNWIKTSEQLPETKKRNYQVIALCKKKYVGGNYDGEPKKTIVQNWVIRQWPNNFLYWSHIPALPPEEYQQ